MTGYPPQAQRRLLDLQVIDSRRDALDQHWRDHPAVAVLSDLEERDVQLAAEQRLVEQAAVEAQQEVRRTEREAEQIRGHQDRDRRRLDAGAVSSPRELESLQHEIATLQGKLTTIEDVELEAMQRLEDAEGRLAALVQARAEVDAQRAERQAELTAARLAIDTERESLAADRADLVSALPGDLVARYERSRTSHGGVGVGALRHGRCDGCRLELTPTDLVRVRAAAEDALLHCEECGRILVRVEDA
jgi:uncharacterized protein